MRRPAAAPELRQAIDWVRTDPQARFAAILAAVMAYSAGFVVGFILGQWVATTEHDDVNAEEESLA